MSKLRKKYEEERSLPCSVLACHVFMPTWEYVEWLESRVREIDGINLCEGCGKEIDEDDTPFIALTLELNALFWTGDRRLKRNLKERGFALFLKCRKMRCRKKGNDLYQTPD